MSACEKFRVSGRVQGVWYRQSTADKANELGLMGWVRNLSDGSVEVLVCGEQAQRDLLEAWLWEGPAMARVREVSRVGVADEVVEGFEVRR